MALAPARRFPPELLLAAQGKLGGAIQRFRG